jgi:hypothetical protein
MPIKTLAALAAAVLAAAPLAAQTPIDIGQTVTGTLEEGDLQMPHGAHYRSYAIRGRPGQTVMIRMSSEDFDTYLLWGYGTDPDFLRIAENDDWGDGTDSRLVVRLGDEGEYELRAAGFDEDEVGAYELQVTEMPAPPVAGTIRPGDTVEGELAETDYAGIGGYQDHYVVRGRDGDTITIYLRSEEFDPFVVFGLWRNGEVDLTLDDDDSGQGTNAELIAAFYNAAEHRIVVRSYGGEAIGRYTLRLVAGAAPEGWDDEEDEGISLDTGVVELEVVTDTVTYTTTTTDTVVIDTMVVDSLAPDIVVEPTGPRDNGEDVVGFPFRQPIEQSLDDGSPRDAEGRRYEEFVFRARPGRQLQFIVLSDEIHPILQVGTGMNEGFRALARDDPSETGQRTEDLTWTVESPRAYTFRVTADRPGVTGSYVLLVQTPN